MSIEITGQGSLFSSDFLTETIQQTPEWQTLSSSECSRVEGKLRSEFDKFPINQNTNESQTEDDLIWPVLSLLGWADALRQQNLSAKGRDDVPDGLLFQGGTAKENANKQAQEWKRYSFGAAIVESKRWLRPLDRRSGKRGEETAPSTQMLRYLRRIDDVTSGSLRWGILTNGAKWRLYFSLHSPSGVSFEVKIACIRALDKDFLPQAAPAVAQTAGSGRIRPRSRCFLAQGRRFSAQRTDLSSRFRSV